MRKLINFDSGLKLVFVRNSGVRSVAIGVFVGAGAVTESGDIAGISHFIEHMVFKGTTTRSSFDIVNRIDSLGAQINAYTSKSCTCFHTVSIDEAARDCAEILSDLYFDPAFDRVELEKERRVIFEEINESEDSPEDVCVENLLTAYFKGSPLEKPILGSKKTLAKMDENTLREYHKKFYIPSNTVIAIAGNMSESEAVALVEDYFESKFAAAYPHPEVISSARRHDSRLILAKKSIEQAHVALAFPSYPYNDPHGVAVQLLTTIFSTEMSSRLFQSIREKLGLCYTIYGYPSQYKNDGTFTIYTSTSPTNAEAAVKAIRQEILHLLSDGVTDEELKKGKMQLKSSMVLGQESTSAMMRTYGTHAVMTGELYDFDGRIKRIERVSKDDFTEVARKIFDFDEVCASAVAPMRLENILQIVKG